MSHAGATHILELPWQIAQELLKISPEMDVACADQSRRTALHVAAERGYSDMAEFLVLAVPQENRDAFCCMQDNLGYTALHYAAQGGFLRILEILIEACAAPGALVNSLTLDGHSALSLAVKGGYTNDFATVLLAAGAKQGDQSSHGALHWACERGYTDMAKMLISRGADVNAEDMDGNTPLVVALQSGSGASPDIIRHLLESKADVDFPFCGNQGTALHWACEHGQKAIVGLLLQHEAACNALNGDRETPFMVSAVPGPTPRPVGRPLAHLPPQPWKDLNAWCHGLFGCILAQVAARKGRSDVLQVLIHHEPNLMKHASTAGGTTVLHWAAHSGHDEALAILLPKSAKTILQGDETARTPLHLAAEAGYLTSASLITQAWAKSTGQGTDAVGQLWGARDNKGRTVLHTACAGGHLDIARHALSSLLPPGGPSARAGGRRRAIQTHVMAQDQRKQTPLHLASAVSGEVVDLLLESADPEDATEMISALDAELRTPLHFACHEGHLEAVKALVRVASGHEYTNQLLTAAGEDGLTPLHLAVTCGYSAIVQHILATCAQQVIEYMSPITSLTFLSWGARQGYLDFVSQLLLLDTGGSSDALFWKRDRDHFLAFHHAVQVGSQSGSIRAAARKPAPTAAPCGTRRASLLLLVAPRVATSESSSTWPASASWRTKSFWLRLRPRPTLRLRTCL